MQIRFGTDGVRGVANEALTVELALAIGRAAVRVFPTSSVAVGRDTRRSGQMLEMAVAAGISSEGADAVLMGVVPTPAVASTSAREGITGIMISASHNPFGDNGIKIFAPGGRKLTDAEQESIEETIADLLGSGGNPGPTGVAVGVVRTVDDTDAYLDELAAAIEGRSLTGLRVVVDCANGSNWELAPRLLRRLDVRVDVIGDEPDGTNINDGCGSTDTAPLTQRVVSTGADLGIAFDGDADRLIAVDNRGEIVDGDHIIALFALDLAERSKLRGDTVVVTVMSNLGFFRAMDAAGIEVVATQVGDRNVLQALADGGYSLGGEQSGHIIFNDVSTTGDGLLAAVMLLDLLVRSRRSLADCATAAMTRLPQVLVNVPVSGNAVEAVDRISEAVARAEAELGSNGRVLVRASGTEPLVRVMVEAVDEGLAEKIADSLASTLVAP